MSSSLPPSPSGVPVSGFLVDSHCHVHFPEFAQDLPQVVARSQQAGVRAFLTVCTQLEQMASLGAVLSAYPMALGSVGVHPNDCGAYAGREVELEEVLRTHARTPKIIALGETGLDYYYDRVAPEVQKACFRAHLRASRHTGLPVIIHTRQAEEDTLRLLEEAAAQGPVRGVFHCFSSQGWLAERAVALGFYISFAGMITFKNADALREVVERIPLNRILVETDSPYLAPVPHRGGRNEPAYVVNTARKIGDLHGVSMKKICSQTTENFLKLFLHVPPSISRALGEAIPTSSLAG